MNMSRFSFQWLLWIFLILKLRCEWLYNVFIFIILTVKDTHFDKLLSFTGFYMICLDLYSINQVTLQSLAALNRFDL